MHFGLFSLHGPVAALWVAFALAQRINAME
jgi:hypothetical protein